MTRRRPWYRRWGALYLAALSVSALLLLMGWPRLVQRRLEAIPAADAAWIGEAVRVTQWEAAILAAVILILLAIIPWAMYAHLCRRLNRIAHLAEEYARGDFRQRMPATRVEEVARVAESLNWMAAQMEERMQTADRQRNEQEAVLASMSEGILAVDNRQHVIDVNRAATTMLAIDAQQARGRPVPGVIRNPDLQQFISHTLSAAAPMERDLTLHGAVKRIVRVSGAPLSDNRGQRIGSLIVLNDITRVRRLEDVRRDFVANVSHELKTPITSIKGFMETLMDGAMDHPDDARRFIEIIAKQADRLDAIIEDLLSLSRIEQESERGEIALKSVRLADVVDSAVLSCQGKAESKGIRIHPTCDGAIQGRINAPLLEQALINLVDNAIKYSDEGRQIWVEAGGNGKEIHLAVRDEGCGIPRDHLERIFERFYRVDKSRSRQQGGTGLGLSIVKHIAQAHKGRVTVESEVGRGSTFRIHIPVSGP